MVRLFIPVCLIFCTLLSCKDAKMTHAESKVTDTKSIKISLAQWSLHKLLEQGKMEHLDFAAKANELGFEGIEYVNTFFQDKAQDLEYLDLMNQKAKDAGVEQLLIMIDSEGDLGDKDPVKRAEAVSNHQKWVDAAAYLGCHSIRVNAAGEGTAEEVMAAAKEGLAALTDYAATKNINVIVENHGGYSSNGQWLVELIKTVNKPNCGTLPDFGNFCVKKDENAPEPKPCIEEYDKYTGVSELMQFAKAVSAKSYDFDENGNETSIDYARMMDIVRSANYKGFIGVEYEGDRLDEQTGILATKDLILKTLNNSQ